MPGPIPDRRAWPPGVSPIKFTMRDGWPVRLASAPALTEESRGTILWLGGRGDFIEKYLETIAYWRRAGWAVVAFDWRGQGGSGRLIPESDTGHIEDFAIWIDDLAEIWRTSVLPHSGPHVAIGHSMGGHLLLRAIAERRIAPHAGVLVAPMLGFETPPLPVPLVAAIVRCAVAIGFGRHRAWPANERPALPNASRQAFLTHDRDRYADEAWWRAEAPDLALGPPSLSWLRAAHQSTKRLFAKTVPESVSLPLLLMGTHADQLVSPRAIVAMAARLPNATLKMFGDEAAHELLREADSLRNSVLGEIDVFLEKTVPSV